MVHDNCKIVCNDILIQILITLDQVKVKNFMICRPYYSNGLIYHESSWFNIECNDTLVTCLRQWSMYTSYILLFLTASFNQEAVVIGFAITSLT